MAFYDLVPAQFNQLLVFDDRLIHAVPQIQGNMAPQDGRVVIHGHIWEGGPFIRGPLAQVAAAEAVVSKALHYVRSKLERADQGYHGCVSVRLQIEADGRVVGAATLSDRVYRTAGPTGDPERLVSELASFLATLRFPAAEGRSVVTVPVPIG